MPYAAQLMTAEDLMANPVPNKCTELVAGQILVREPPGYRHGYVASQFLMAIGSFVRENRLGHVLAAETGFTLFRNPDTVRAPDVAFLCSERVPSPIPSGYAELAPDLAVEVISPADRAGTVLAKVGDWIDAGARLVWIVDPERRHARVYRADATETFVDADGMLDGEDVLPGLRILLTDVMD